MDYLVDEEGEPNRIFVLGYILRCLQHLPLHRGEMVAAQNVVQSW